MTEALIQHIQKFCTLSDEAAAQLADSFVIAELPKRTLLVTEGALCPNLYFVTKGCLRMFYHDDKGTEQTIQFALETWWMTDLDAFHKKGNASFSIQAIENTTVLSISKQDFDILLANHSGLEKYFRMIYERAYAASLFRMRFFRLSKEDGYDLFCIRYPEFIQRIPQKILASFLGFTPEYLSELRKKKSEMRS